MESRLRAPAGSQGSGRHCQATNRQNAGVALMTGIPGHKDRTLQGKGSETARRRENSQVSAARPITAGPTPPGPTTPGDAISI
jgi:hypothetical protein